MAFQDLQMLGGGAPQIYNAPQQSNSFLQGLGNFFTGQPAQTQFLQRFNPQQQQALSQILSQALSGLQNPSEGFQPIANQARQQFQQQTVPSIAERFSSLGSGAQRSSAFQNALGQAGSGLESQLAALQSQYGLQKGGQLQQILGFGLTPQFESIYHQRQPGFLESSAQSLSSLLPLLAFL